MFKTLLFLLLTFVAQPFLLAQNQEKELGDTIQFIIDEIKSLTDVRFDQDAVKLNFDNCNLEIHQTPIGESDRWNVYSFWLPHLDEKKMQLQGQDDGSWQLILASASSKIQREREKEIQYDKDTGSGYTTQVVVYSSEKQPLIEIGQAIYYAILECKGLDRFR